MEQSLHIIQCFYVFWQGDILTLLLIINKKKLLCHLKQGFVFYFTTSFTWIQEKVGNKNIQTSKISL